MIDIALAGTCGIYCGSCPFYRAYHDNDIAFQKGLADLYKCDVEDVRCNGCSSEEGCQTKEIFYPGKDCPVKQCSQQRGLSFCYECNEFPCEELKKISKKMHDYCNMNLIENLRAMKELGVGQWLLTQDRIWTCKVCGSKLNSHDKICRLH